MRQILIFFSFSLCFWTRHYYKRLALQIIESIIHFKAQKGGTYVVLFFEY